MNVKRPDDFIINMSEKNRHYTDLLLKLCIRLNLTYA